MTGSGRPLDVSVQLDHSGDDPDCAGDCAPVRHPARKSNKATA
jgi:hypothetical protein